MSGTGRVAVVGSLNADLVVRTERRPAGGETVTGSDLVEGSGGKGSNQAVAAARCGAPVSLLGALGDDGFGRRLRAELQDEDIDVSAVSEEVGVPTGTALIVVDAAGENAIVVSPGANARVDAALVETRRGWFADAAVVCLCLEIPPDAVLAGARQGRDAGAQVLLNLSPYAEVPPDLLALTDVLLVNEHELALLLDGAADETWPDRARALADRGVDRAVVTLGAQGSMVLQAAADGVPTITPIPPIEVSAVDTTGCGDAFTGTLAASLAAGCSLLAAAELAGRVSAQVATRPGAQASFPTRAEVSALRAGTGTGSG